MIKWYNVEKRVILMKKVMLRWYYLKSYEFLAIKRACLLRIDPLMGKNGNKFMDLIIYLIWLLSNLGWKRGRISLSEYSISLLRLVIGLAVVYSVSHIDILIYSTYIYNQITDPQMSDSGYMIHASIVMISLVWGSQVLLLIFFKRYRGILRPYWKEFLLIHLIALVLLVSIYGGVDRAKFGLLVWYATERFHPMRTHALDYWGTGWVG